MAGPRTDEIIRRIEALLSDAPTRIPGIEVVAVELPRDGRRTIIRVFIERDGSIPRPVMGGVEEAEVPVLTGVSHEDCTRVTRILGDHLDGDPGLGPLLDALGAYVLEVSSPGIERPLRTAAHFSRFRGEVAAITTNEKILGRANHSGVIAEVTPEFVILDQPDLGRTEIRFTEIKKAHLKCDPWQMARAAARQKQSESSERAKS